MTGSSNLSLACSQAVVNRKVIIENNGMSASGPTKRVTLTLKQFKLRQEVLALYRKYFRTINQISCSNQKKDVADWIRSDFRSHAKSCTLDEEQHVRSLLFQGSKVLNELKQNVDLSKA